MLITLILEKFFWQFRLREQRLKTFNWLTIFENSSILEIDTFTNKNDGKTVMKFFPQKSLQKRHAISPSSTYTLFEKNNHRPLKFRSTRKIFFICEVGNTDEKIHRKFISQKCNFKIDVYLSKNFLGRI